VLDPLAQAARFPASPIAWTPTGQPASAPSRTICSSSSPLVMTTPLPSDIQAVCEPSVPSMNVFR